MIRIRDMAFSFPRQTVLDGLSIDIEEARVTVIVGRSGIGKSVLLRCITGLLTPQSGSITIDDREVVGASRQELLDIRSKVGMLFQEGALFDSMNVYDNVAFPLAYHKKVGAVEIDRKVREFLERVGMTDAAKAMPRELSGGMKRKAAIARAMIMEPKYLLYDEPTSGLDPESSAIVEVMIRRLQNESAITSLVVTHDIDLTRFLADRIALMESGKITALEYTQDAFKESSPIYGHFIEKRERIRQENAR